MNVVLLLIDVAAAALVITTSLVARARHRKLVRRFDALLKGDDDLIRSLLALIQSGDCATCKPDLPAIAQAKTVAKGRARIPRQYTREPGRWPDGPTHA